MSRRSRCLKAGRWAAGATPARAPVESSNLVGVIPGADRRLSPVLIGAHYDSVIAAPSADDNAAAVAIALSAVGALRATGAASTPPS